MILFFIQNSLFIFAILYLILYFRINIYIYIIQVIELYSRNMYCPILVNQIAQKTVSIMTSLSYISV